MSDQDSDYWKWMIDTARRLAFLIDKRGGVHVPDRAVAQKWRGVPLSDHRSDQEIIAGTAVLLVNLLPLLERLAEPPPVSEPPERGG